MAKSNVSLPRISPLDPYEYRDLSFPSLVYVFLSASGFRILRFGIAELATPAVQNILRIMSDLHGKPIIWNQLGSFVSDQPPTQSEAQDALKFFGVLDERVA